MPQIPTSIIGHATQTAQLLSDIEKKNVAHSYLFSGPRHIGKFTVAHWFAWHLLSGGMSDQEQEKVRKSISKLTHPDLLVLDRLWMEEKQDAWEYVTETSNVPQAHRAKRRVRTDTIGIDDIRAITDRLHETPSSPYVCCLIRSIERMQAPAANAFLKILEEPPPRVVFLLTTESSASLPPTIVSRTRNLLFHPVGRQEIRPLVRSLSAEEAAFIEHLSQGAPGFVLELLHNPDLLREEKLLHGQARRFWQAASLHERLQWLLSLQQEKKDLAHVLLHLGLALREQPKRELLPARHRSYMRLLADYRTNAHKGLLLGRFALSVTRAEC